MIRSYVLPRVMLLTLVATSLACSLGSGLGFSGGGSAGSADGGVVGDLALVADELPTFGPDAPPPSPGAAALRALSVLDPSVTEMESDVEAAERAAFTALLADMQGQLGVGSAVGYPLLAAPPGAGKVAILAPYSPVPAAFTQMGTPDGINTAGAAGLIAAATSGLSDLWSPSVEAGAHNGGSVTETEGAATTTSTIKLGRGTDGSTVMEWGGETEASKDGVSVKTGFAGSVEGMRCPSADGQVSFTVKVRLVAESGGAGYTQDLTAFVRAEVNDDASISRTTFDLVQGTRQVKDGRPVYVESGETVKYEGDDVAGLKYSNVRMIRYSQDTTQADASALSIAGSEAAFAMARTALVYAKNNWLDGGCTKIEAPSPGTVEPGSSTAIPVAVRHRFDGSMVPSKLKAELAGAESVDPTSLAKTPGSLTYTAPSEEGKSATIVLTATSRRGKAKLELTANTGMKVQSYQVIETPGIGRTWTGACIDDLARPFSVSFVAPEGTTSFALTPTSATAGSLVEEYHFAMGGTTMDYSGTGSYRIEPSDWDAEGRVTGMEIFYDTSGDSLSCAGTICQEEPLRLGAQIPLKVQDGACP